MAMLNVFQIAGSGMSAQTVRINTVASNLANANSTGSTEDTVYRARMPVFRSVYKAFDDGGASLGVETLGVMQRDGGVERVLEPGNPMADEEGYVYRSNVDPVEEMVNMMSAARTFQNNVEVLNTTRQLLSATLRLGE